MKPETAEARLAECEQTAARIASERACLEIDCHTLRAQLTETRKMLEVQLAVGDKLQAELAALRERQIPLEAGWKTLAMVIERYPDVLLDFDRQLRNALNSQA